MTIGTGVALPEPRYCTSCGTKLAQVGNFCPTCGGAVMGVIHQGQMGGEGSAPYQQSCPRGPQRLQTGSTVRSQGTSSGVLMMVLGAILGLLAMIRLASLAERIYPWAPPLFAGDGITIAIGFLGVVFLVAGVVDLQKKG